MIATLGRVARVIDRYTLVLNKGVRDGVEMGDKFLIFGEGEDVIDPENGSNLGPLEVVRGRAKVTHLQDAICTIKCTDTTRVPGVKRVIKRSGTLGMIIGSPHEEIEEGPSIEEEPFDKPEVGDFARPI
jgi:hypothetical protein